MSDFASCGHNSADSPLWVCGVGGEDDGCGASFSVCASCLARTESTQQAIAFENAHSCASRNALPEFEDARIGKLARTDPVAFWESLTTAQIFALQKVALPKIAGPWEPLPDECHYTQRWCRKHTVRAPFDDENYVVEVFYESKHDSFGWFVLGDDRDFSVEYYDVFSAQCQSVSAPEFNVLALEAENVLMTLERKKALADSLLRSEGWVLLDPMQFCHKPRTSGRG